jgi:hypothetical protein
MAEFDYSRVLLCTFIHCSARCIDSKLRATVAGLIRSSARSLSPSRLVAAASDIGAKRISSASQISDERTTSSKLVSGSASSRTSSATPGAAVSAGSVAASVITSASGTTP